MNRKVMSIPVILLLVLGLTMGQLKGNAQEAGNGGQVSTEGGITFYEEKVDPPKPSVPGSKPAKPTPPKLPQTGGNRWSVLASSGFGIVLLGFLIILLRIKRKEHTDDTFS